MLRILGPRSVGVSHASGFDASILPQPSRAGSLALIVQSQSVAAAAVDWAAGRQLGFSWTAVTGGEADVDVADLLDYAALDRDTRAVAVEVGRIRGARKFMSAARACARAKPTVILQTRLADRDAAGADPVRSAAFARAGLVEVPSLPGLFDALAALQRLPALTRPRVLVVANGAALCALSVDAVLRQKLDLSELPEAVRRELGARLPGVRFRPGAVDIGDPPLAVTLAVLERLEALDSVDALMFVRSPMAGHPHEPFAEALAGMRLGPRILTVWLGLASALAARQLSASAGQSTFTSPDAAARAIAYRWEYARNRELLTQTPPRFPPPQLDLHRVQRRLLDHLGQGSDGESAAALELLEAYGIASQPRLHRDALELDLRVERHLELGLHIAARIRGFGLLPWGHAFVPLDTLLADRLLVSIGLDSAAGISAGDRAAAGAALVRLAQIPIDQPAVERIELRLALRGGRARVARDARLWLTPGPAPERERLALAPYPQGLRQSVELRNGAMVELRPVRPEDEPAVIALLQDLDAESVRLRFFAHIRHFSHAMAARMTQIDYDRELALVVYAAGAPERLHALATLIADPDGAVAEFALVVHQDHARHGLGRALLGALLAHARQQRIGCLWGQVLAENRAMLGLARALGFRVQADPQEPSCRRVEWHSPAAPSEPATP
jgi:GNAT superfamily N-acetyltransferase